MKRRFLLPAAFGLLLASSVAASGSPWLTRLDEALSRAEAKDRLILVDLYAEWCGWCKVLEDKVFTTPEFREFARDFVLLRVDVEDGAEGSALQARFGLYSLPTTLVMDQHQVKVGTVEGFAPTPAFLQKLSAELASYEAFLEYYEKMKTSEDLGVLYQLAQELHFSRGDGARAVEVVAEILRRTGEASPKAAYLNFLMADAYRLAGRFEEAQQALEKARSLTKGEESLDLAERIDMLSFRIAQDSRNCDKAKKSLELFLTKHPKSSIRRQAREALDAIEKGHGQGCA